MAKKKSGKGPTPDETPDELKTAGGAEPETDGDEAQTPAPTGGTEGTVYVPGGFNFDFTGTRRTGYLVSALIILVSLASVLTRGFNWGIEFTGGRVYRYRFHDKARATIDEVRTRLISDEMEKLLGKVVIQQVKTTDQAAGVGADGVEFLIFTRQYEERDAKDDPVPKMEARFADLGGATKLSALEVGATIGETITTNAVKAVLLGMLLVLGYMAIQFDFRWGLAAIIALIHDIIVTLGIFSIFQRELTSDTLAAILTIIGYSVNDTIVVMDRVRENMGVPSLRRKFGYEGIFNLSINQTMTRTLNTFLLTLVPSVTFLAVGGPVIWDFALAMAVGLISGAYSTVWIVSAVLVDWHYHEHPGLAADRAKAKGA